MKMAYYFSDFQLVVLIRKAVCIKLRIQYIYVLFPLHSMLFSVFVGLFQYHNQTFSIIRGILLKIGACSKSADTIQTGRHQRCPLCIGLVEKELCTIHILIILMLCSGNVPKSFTVGLYIIAFQNIYQLQESFTIEIDRSI